MALFTVRVDLLDGTTEDYAKLATALYAEGMDSVLKDSKNNLDYLMPPGNYNYEGTITRGDLRDRAQKCAQGTGKAFWVLVTESAGRAWHGLPEAPHPSE